MMLRRLKEDVEKSLAPKEETIVEVRLYVFLPLILHSPTGRADCNSEAVLSCHIGAQLLIPDKREHCTQSTEHYDGVTKVLQSSFPHCWCENYT